MIHETDIRAASAAPVRFTIAQPALAAALAIAAKVIERRNTVPILSNAMVTVEPGGLITIRATDLDVVSLSTARADSVDVPGCFTVCGNTLRDVVRKADKRAMITVAAGEGRATVMYGRARQSLATLPADDFPTPDAVPAAFTFALDGDTLARDLERLTPAIMADETRYYAQGVRIMADGDALRMDATNGYAAVTIKRGLPIGADGLGSTIIPRKVVGLLRTALKAAPGVSVGVSCAADVFGFALTLALPGLTIISKVIDGTFPDVSRSHPGDDLAHLVTLDAGELASRFPAVDKRGSLTIEPGPDGMRCGTPAAATAIAGETVGDPAPFAFPYPFGAIAKVLGGSLDVAFACPNSTAVVTDPAAPELSVIVKLTPGATLPAAPAPARNSYTAPAGQAADLFGAFGLDGGESSRNGGGGSGPRKATDAEARAYLRDYADRAGLPAAPDAKGAEHVVYWGDVAAGMVRGLITADAGYSEREIVCYETLTTRIDRTYSPAQWSDGAYCVVMPGTYAFPVTMSVDGGEAQAVGVDAKGAILITRAAVVDATGLPDEKPARASRKPARIIRPAAVAAAQAAEPVPAPVEAAEPVSPAGDPLPVDVEALAPVAETIPADWMPSDAVIDAMIATEDTPEPADDLAATVRALVARVAALEAGAPAAPVPVAGRDRSPARLRLVRAYLAMRRQRDDARERTNVANRAYQAAVDDLVAANKAHNARANELIAQRMVAEDATHGAMARVEAEIAKRGRVIRLARKRGRARAHAIVLCKAAQRDLHTAMRRADTAERLNRLGSRGDLPAPTLILPAAFAPVRETVDA